MTILPNHPASPILVWRRHWATNSRKYRSFGSLRVLQVVCFRKDHCKSNMNKALRRRIRQQVQAREKQFFAVTAPGLKQLCLTELRRLIPDAALPTVAPGGIAFAGRLTDVYLANLCLRTANRVLMRLLSFKATNFGQLNHHLSGFPWELYLHAGMDISVRVTARRSRLYHSSAIMERAKRCIRNRLEGSYSPDEAATASAANQTIYIRALEDRFTISVDSSGKPLYKRGIIRSPFAAPIRETLASAILHLAGYSGRKPLLDPMCGSGTFSIEAAMIAKHIPPGWFRKFAFMNWPAFKPEQWAYLKKNAGKCIRPDAPSLIQASDIQKKACEELKKSIGRYDLLEGIDVAVADFFSLDPDKAAHQPGLIVINPPYGRRIGSRLESRRLIRAISDRLKLRYQGWQLALILPGRRHISTVPFHLKTHPITHGGLSLTLVEGTIP